MVLYRRSRIANAPYFLTATLREQRSSLLTDPIALPGQAFRTVRRRHPFRVDAIVVLPKHFHLLCSLRPTARIIRHACA